MPKLTKLREFKELVQAMLEGNEESLQAFGKAYGRDLKAYLVESNVTRVDRAGCPDGEWEALDAEGWYTNRGGANPQSFFLDATSTRVWKIYSIVDATQSDGLIAGLVSRSRGGLDYCWLTREHMLSFEAQPEWNGRGLGLRFGDGLSPEEGKGNFSLKAWQGAYNYLEDLNRIMNEARDRFAVYSARWQKIENGATSMLVEWYSNGKLTVNRGLDADEVLAHATGMALKYSDSLDLATELRNDRVGAFEFTFSQRINLERFTNAVGAGSGDMRLWLIETENDAEFRRFKGVDLHTWDRVFLDVGTNFAFITVPGKGCVNAVPRLAVLQGEDNAGKTEILYNGETVFA